MSCVTTVQYSILINGGITSSVTPGRGRRQKDPLSPYLFILCSEFLSRMLAIEESKGELYGIKVCRNAQTISHLLYADDMVIMCKVSRQDASVVQRCLDKYCAGLGQAINSKKSSIFFSKNTRREDKSEVKKFLEIKEMRKESMYLGNNLILSLNKAKDFKSLIDSVSNKMEG